MFGLCAYALMYTGGFAGQGTPRANPRPLGVTGLLDLAVAHGLNRVEFSPRRMLPECDSEALERVRQQAAERGLAITLDGGRVGPDLADRVADARAIGADTIRCTLSGILCGDRSPVGLTGWEALLDAAVATLRDVVPALDAANLRLGVENHQDATSWDLVNLCERVGSPRVGVTLDTGNPLAVGESVEAFVERVEPYLVNVHLKDYHLFPTPEGFRLAHAASGTGVVDFPRLFARLRPEVARSLEQPALEARHIKLLTDAWWAGFPPRDVREVLPVLRLREERASQGEWRTPWELGEDGRLVEWELDRLATSVACLRRAAGAKEHDGG